MYLVCLLLYCVGCCRCQRVASALYTGVDGRMANKPFLLPETFSGESGTKWDEWINHFESCADVNNWTKDEDRLKWVRVRLVGKAQTAFRRLGEDERTDYSKCVGALKRRFDPDSKRTLKVVELQHRKKEKGEDWASFGDALRLLADSAYPELEEKARECLALNQFLSQLDNPQVAFGVKQKRPQTVDEAALAAMELESYLHPCKPMTVGFLPMSQNTAPATTDEDDGTASSIASVQTKTDPALEAIKELVERLDRLERLVSSKAGGQKSESKKWNARKRDSIVCWNCGGKGHVARECATPKQHEQQENFLPSVQRAKHERGPRGPLN